MDRLEGKVYVISVEVRTEIPFAFAQDDIPFGVPLAAAINERGGIPHIYGQVRFLLENCKREASKFWCGSGRGFSFLRC